METNFVSAVIYLGPHSKASQKEIVAAHDVLRGMFKTYEIVLVDDGCVAATVRQLAMAVPSRSCSIVHMGMYQGIEAAMNAGLDAAVGDYVFEIDDIVAFDTSFFERAYAQAMAGFDIVNGIPDSGTSGRASLFYMVFNHFSEYSTKLATNPCRLVSRRAINRVRSISGYAPYRKASYAACGLRVTDVVVSGTVTHQTDAGMAVTSLALYTSAFYQIAFWLAAAMAILSLLELVYVIVIAVSGIAVTGWVTTMFVLTLGFLALFVLFAFALKYLDILVNITFVRQGYLVEGIERLDGTEQHE